MRILRLYLQDFSCYEHAFIDFREFSSALIVGKQDNNDHFANGVGKTTIFKAIEYVLFNYSDAPLDKLIRDDMASCKVVLDFSIGDQEYRLSRSRSKTSDLVLLERGAKDGADEEVYHSVSGDTYTPYTSKEKTEGYWKDLSGSRAGDTEKDLVKLIKINQKAFRSTVLFRQHDISGLPTVTPEKRKGILKEALNLGIYTKLEKLAKEKAAIISKDIDKHKILIDGLGDPEKELIALEKELATTQEALQTKTDELSRENVELNALTQKVNELNVAHSNTEAKFASLLTTQKSLQSDKSRLETSVKEYTSKKSNDIKIAKELIADVNALKNTQIELALLDYSQIDILTEQVEKKKEEVTTHNIKIKTSLETLEELKIPLPSGSVCKNCRKPMTDNDRKEHREHIAKEKEDLEIAIATAKNQISLLNKQIGTNLQTINSLKLSKQKLERVITDITTKNNEIKEKSTSHDDHLNLLNKFKLELESKNADLEAVLVELKNSSQEEANLLKQQIEEEKRKIATLMTKISALNKEVAHFTSSKAVIQHSIDQKTKDKSKKETMKKSLMTLEFTFSSYPSVIQAFSSTGIPNLIIHNVLDDLQIETNALLAQIKPGIQLSFSIEKTIEKTGDQADTLEINYTHNGRDRYYEQLSGAQQLAVVFSLKIGLSFLLQKLIGSDIKFLLLDEVDFSFDKASVDAFAEIVKFFQREYTILVITHNDHLKDKFSHAILVEQDANMISKANVVSSW